jgi:hypothetical protein
VGDIEDFSTRLELASACRDDELLIVFGDIGLLATWHVTELAVGARDNDGPDAFMCIASEDATRAQGFVVWMRVDRHEGELLIDWRHLPTALAE